VYVNGELVENTYGTGETLKQQGAVIYPYTVRKGNVFALGDNRTVSVDSRSFGEVNKVQIRGKIILRLGKWYVESVGS
jgi:signal peptidase I